jgi:putative aminopeptidase FrvX
MKGMGVALMKRTPGRQSKAPRKGGVHTQTTDMAELIAELSEVCGPPGREEEVRQHVVRKISTYAEHIETSPLGAAHAIVGRGGQPRWMIAANMDEVGVIISHSDPSGFARFALLGNKDPATLAGHAVRFAGGRVAVIRVQTGARNAAITVDDLVLDFGGPIDGQPAIGIGDIGCLDSGTHRLGSRFVASNAGGRAGVAVLIRTLQLVERSSAELQFVFSVQGEFGGDGGLTSAAALGPQVACVVCPAPSQDTPGSTAQQIRLGGGPVLVARHGRTASDPRLVQAMASLAKKDKIGYQLGTLDVSLPGSGLPAAHGGVRTVWLGIPCRGLGTTSEMVDLGDVDGTGHLLTALVQSAQDLI